VKTEMKKIAVLGCPFDSTSSYRSGSRFAPAVIRNTLREVEDYSPHLDGDLRDIDYCDEGDVVFVNNDKEQALDLIKKTVRGILSENKMPLVLGGEHLITLPVVQAVREKYKDIKVLYLDAHCDLRDEYLGVKLSHATVARRLLDFISPGSLFQFGIRSGEREEFRFARKHGILYDFSRKKLDGVLKKIGKPPLHISIDLDILNPAIFPGTGVPDPGGISFDEFIEFIKGLKKAGIVAMDIVELSPPCDHTESSSFLAATVMREMLILAGRRKK
jgi:agmatinase